MPGVLKRWDGTDWTPHVTGGGGSTAFHGASVIRSSGTQSIAHNTFTPVQFNGENFDTDGFHDNATNNSRLTVPTGLGGYYVVFGNLGLVGPAPDKQIIAQFAKNGTELVYTRLRIRLGGSSADNTGVHIGAVLSLAAGDYVTLTAYHDHGSSVDVANDGTSFSMHLVGT